VLYTESQDKDSANPSASTFHSTPAFQQGSSTSPLPPSDIVMAPPSITITPPTPMVLSTTSAAQNLHPIGSSTTIPPTLATTSSVRRHAADLFKPKPTSSLPMNRKHAADLFKSKPTPSHVVSASSSVPASMHPTSPESAALPAAKAPSILAQQPHSANRIIGPSSVQSQQRRHAADLFTFEPTPSTSTPSTSQPFLFNFKAPQPSSATAQPMKPVELRGFISPTDSMPGTAPTTSRPTTSRPTTPPSCSTSSFPKFVFKTDNLLETRKTDRSWQGSRQAAEWILSREELHAQQVDLDRWVPKEIDHSDFPSFVSPFKYLSFILSTDLFFPEEYFSS
jgi:hypothetical protein